MLARIPADVSKRLLILTCAAALLAGACSNLPEADVNFGSGKEFVPYVADHLDDAGLGNAVALDKDGVPYVSYFIFTAKPVPGAIPIPRPLGAPFITTGGDKPKDGAAVGVASVSSDGIWTRGAAAQVIDSPTGIIVPYDPDTVDGLIGATPDNTNGTDIARRRERRQARRLGGPGRHLVRDRHRIVQGERHGDRNVEAAALPFGAARTAVGDGERQRSAAGRVRHRHTQRAGHPRRHHERHQVDHPDRGHDRRVSRLPPVRVPRRSPSMPGVRSSSTSTVRPAP